MNAALREPSGEFLGGRSVTAATADRDDRTLPDALVVHAPTGVDKPLAQLRGTQSDRRLDPIGTPNQRVIHGGADRQSQPIASTSMSSCPTDWQASIRNGTSADRASAPISAAGFTSPPLVGTCVSDTRATSPPLNASAIAATDT